MELTKEQFIRDFKDILHERQLIKVADATPRELFQALANTVRKYITPLWLERRKKLVEHRQKQLITSLLSFTGSYVRN